jgi:galactokinase
MDKQLIQRTKEIYASLFEDSPSVESWGPGRVNLIGEHTDYNAGYVLPMAVNRGVYLCGQARADGKILLYSADYQDRVEFETGKLFKDPSHPWADYFKGVLAQYLDAGGKFHGCQAVLKGDLPQGAGLSSSAALEVASAVFLEKISGLIWTDLDLIKAAQTAENQFVGVNCGIMDPFASFLGRENNALMIDCRNLSFEWFPIHPEVNIVVCNSGVKRALSQSAYNQRRQECEEGVRLLSHALPQVNTLRDLSMADLERHRELLPENILKRCRHVVSENQRVLDMVRALEKNDLVSAGTLMARSHESLRDDYEVSCRELDLLVELARKNKSVYGARMTGAGFGGCTVNLIEENGVESFRQQAGADYKSKTGLNLASYVFNAAPGAKFYSGREI